MLDSEEILAGFKAGHEYSAEIVQKNKQPIGKNSPGKIVHIAIAGQGLYSLIALCEDGSIWTKEVINHSSIYTKEWTKAKTPHDQWNEIYG